LLLVVAVVLALSVTVTALVVVVQAVCSRAHTLLLLERLLSLLVVAGTAVLLA
jgi:hypothetical protein